MVSMQIDKNRRKYHVRQQIGSGFTIVVVRNVENARVSAAVSRQQFLFGFVVAAKISKNQQANRHKSTKIG